MMIICLSVRLSVQRWSCRLRTNRIKSCIVIVGLYEESQVAHNFSQFQLFQRFTTFLSVTLSLFVGTTILSEYFNHRKKEAAIVT